MSPAFSGSTDGDDRADADGASENERAARTSSRLAVLLVDDNRHVSESLAVTLRLAGHAMDSAAGPEEALSRLATRRYDSVLLDLNYAAGRTDGREGLTLLTRILADDPTASVIVLTAHSGIRLAVEAMRIGARDFVMKPWRNADLLAKLTAAATHRPARTLPPPPVGTMPATLIGESDGMVRVRDLVRRLGPTRAGVVVTGRPGSGRSSVAAALHLASTCAGEPLTRVDLRDRKAWTQFEDRAGTLLLRHPDLLDAVEQVRLLDCLPPSARCIAVAGEARDIHPALARRIAAVEIVLPPLAERGGDALLLARHFAREASERHGRPMAHLTPAAERTILETAWPDEVRGLAAAVERAVLLGEDEAITAAALTATIPVAAEPTAAAAATPSRFDLDRNERGLVEAALREHRHNVTRAAAALGLSRAALYRRMERHGL